ncbi:MAG: rRNA adenine N-6-methyltransferase family protein [Nanoarchaeota archaeon]|nr:rRNA adenine N-6-methyltransferase family protein [Nanoarchaeota archaeon]
MTLQQKTEQLLLKYNLTPQRSHEQHFLIDDAVVKTILKAAALKKNDSILEIGAGLGIITALIAAKVKQVIAIEIDEKLKPVLANLPKNVEVLFGNAIPILPTQKEYTKVVANIPYQISEPLFHALCLSRNLTLAVLTVPKKFALQAAQHPIFSAFLTIEIVQDVPKESFLPMPNVVSAVITAMPKKELDDSDFIRQKLYLQRDKRLKNGLRDCVIDYHLFKGKKLTKKEALKMIDAMKIASSFLEKTIARMPLGMYEEIAQKIKRSI